MVPVQIADKVAEVSRARSRQSSGGSWYKNLPRSSKLLGITHEFILLCGCSSKTCETRANTSWLSFQFVAKSFGF